MKGNYKRIISSPNRLTTYDLRLTTVQGLTLIELLAVILIVSFLILLGVPTFMRFSGSIRLKSASRQVTSLLRMARNLATTQNAACTVTIHPSDANLANHIFVTQGGNPVDKAWVAPQGVEIPDVSQSHGGPQTIQFTPYGTADARSVHIIQKGTLIAASPYDPDANYAAQPASERVKCHTVTTNGNTGRSEIFYYGRNAPWASTDL